MFRFRRVGSDEIDDSKVSDPTGWSGRAFSIPHFRGAWEMSGRWVLGMSLCAQIAVDPALLRIELTKVVDSGVIDTRRAPMAFSVPTCMLMHQRVSIRRRI